MKVVTLLFILIVLAACNSKSTSPGDFGIIPAEAPPTSNIAPLRSSPSIYNFGSVNLNQTKDATLTIINDGILPASVGSVTVSGAGYSIISNGCTSISSGGTCAVTVRYNPTTLGSGNSALKLAYDYQNVSYELEVSLIGYSVSPTAPLTASPSLYNFGTITTGQTSTKTFDITNSGVTTASVSGITISDAIYTVTANTCGATIASGVTCSLTVVFSPTTSGVFVGLLEMSYSSNSINYTIGINISGFGQIPVAPLKANTTLYNFGSVNVGSNKSGTIIFTNQGTTDVTVNSVTLDTGVIYTVTANTCTTILAGATCTIDVEFAPLTTSSLTDLLTVNYSANAYTYSLSLNIFGLGAVTQHYLRIARQSNDTLVTDVNMTQTQTLAIKAIIVDPLGAIIQTVPVSWFINGSSYSNAYLTSTNGSTTTLNASLIGTAVIQATLSDATLIDTYNIQTPTVTTGTITVTASAVADQIQLISGNSQTGTVGTTLGTPLRVRVLNASNQPVQNEAVTFLATTGGSTVYNGASYAASYVTYTDATGYAEVFARLGTTSGTTNNSWSATISSGTVTSVNFLGSAQFGAPAGLAFTTQPNGGNAGSPLLTQPVVKVRDSFGNVITNATNSITLTVGTGSGSLTGTTVVSAVNGIATFSNVSYSSTENGVTIIASSPTLTSATSTSFDVAQILLHAQCLAEGAGWQTREGGCKDLSTGLVWSAISPSAMIWHQIVWDSNVIGPAPDAFDEGRTKDIAAGESIVDSHYNAYCKTLVQSGYEDWITPTAAQFTTSNVDGSVTALKKVDTNGTDRTGSGIWVSNPTAPASVFYQAATDTHVVATISGNPTSTTRYARCIRYPAATQLFIQTQPGSAVTSQIPDPAQPTISSITVPVITSGVTFSQAAVIKIRDASNSPRNIATNAITATLVLGTGTLTGTTSVNAVAGSASFSNLIYTITNPLLQSETIQIAFTSPNLTSAVSSTFTVYRTDPRSQCKLENATWKNRNGGCKNLISGLVIGRNLGVGYTWYEAIWEYYIGNTSPDIYDSGRTSDYDINYILPTTNADNSATNICHDLTESGYQDWFVPWHAAFMLSMTGTNYGTYWKFPLTYAWEAMEVPATQTNGYAATFNADGSTIAYSTIAKTAGGVNTVCARRDPPSKVLLRTAPSNPATGGLPAGIPWSQPIIMQLADADNALHTAPTTITLTITGGTGQWVYNGANVGTSISVPQNSHYGTASFAGYSYSKPGETVTVAATATNIDWQGSTINITPATFSFTTLSMHPQFACHALAAPSFQTQYGGCHDTAHDLVWSYGVTGYNWHEAIWDSLTTGQPANGHPHTVGATNDYDPSQNPAVLFPLNKDADALALCHNLHANGFSDWRVPTYPEASLARNSGLRDALKDLNGAGSRFIWTSTTNAAATAKVVQANDLSGATDSASTKTGGTTNYVFCVRDPTP